MSKILIMLTMTYPYGSGNEFIAKEHEAIEQHYDDIYVFCCAAKKGYGLQERFSPKWHIFRRNEITNGLLRRIIYLCFGFTYFFDKDLQIELQNTKTIISKIATVYYYGRYIQFLKFIKQFLNLVYVDKGNYVVIYSFWFLQTAQCAAAIKKILLNKYDCNIRAITRAHGYDLYTYRNRANFIPFRESILNDLDMIYPCSKNGEMYLKNLYPDSDKKIEHAYLGTFDHGDNKVHSDKEFILVTCSNIIPVKRLSLLADALVYLDNNEVEGISWYCIGEGPLKDELEKFCNKHFKHISYKFIGFLNNDDIFKFYKEKHVDVFVNVSQSEGLPVSIMEAQSEGIPVIATDVGGVSEIISSLNGILLPPNPDAKTVAEAIIEFKTMPPIERDMKRIESRKKWEEYFNAARNYEEFHNNLSSNQVISDN